MRLLTAAGIPSGAHLTYCTNVHPGESWADVRAALRGPVAAVAGEVAGGLPFGIGLRLGARAARELTAPAAREELAHVLESIDAYVFTINAFPYGAFHAGALKEKVYRPDWREGARVDFTRDVAHLLATLLPEGVSGSISTVPGADAERASSFADRRTVAVGIAAAAADLVEVERRTGKTITLALEPEPACLLETAADAATFFREHLFAAEVLGPLGDAVGVDRRSAERMLRRHVGVCLDACHVAVGFERPASALRALEAEGITVAKLQVSVGVEVEGRAAAAATLPALDDGIYLHQTSIASADGAIHRYRDLDEALATGPEGVWRVHAHVPVDREPARPLRTTKPHLQELLRMAREKAFTQHIEVETYTWTVLPAHLRGSDLVEDIARELTWTRRTLEAGSAPGSS